MRSRVIESVWLQSEASVSAFESGVDAPKRGAGRGSRASRSNEKSPGAVLSGVTARWRSGVTSGESRSDGVGFRFPILVAVERVLVGIGERAARKEDWRPPLTGVAIGVEDKKMPPSSSSMGMGGARDGPEGRLRALRGTLRGDGDIHEERRKSGASVSIMSDADDECREYCGRKGEGVSRGDVGDVPPAVCGEKAARYEGETLRSRV